MLMTENGVVVFPHTHTWRRGAGGFLAREHA